MLTPISSDQSKIWINHWVQRITSPYLLRKILNLLGHGFATVTMTEGAGKISPVWDYTDILWRGKNMLWVREMCSNLYYPFHSNPKGLSEIQDDQQEFYNLFRSFKDSLAKGLTFGNTNSSTTIIDTFGLLVFQVLEEIFWVADNLSLPSTFLCEFVKVASYDLVSTMASLYTSPPLSRFLVTTQKLPVKGHRQLQLA